MYLWLAFIWLVLSPFMRLCTLKLCNKVCWMWTVVFRTIELLSPLRPHFEIKRTNVALSEFHFVTSWERHVVLSKMWTLTDVWHYTWGRGHKTRFEVHMGRCFKYLLSIIFFVYKLIIFTVVLMLCILIMYYLQLRNIQNNFAAVIVLLSTC